MLCSQKKKVIFSTCNGFDQAPTLQHGCQVSWEENVGTSGRRLMLCSFLICSLLVD